MLKVIKLKINGKEQETAVDDRESLLDTLRRLGFTSVKKGLRGWGVRGLYGPCKWRGH